MSISSEMFPSDLKDEQEDELVDNVFYKLRYSLTYGDEEDTQHIEKRRHLLGPQADITHQEFGLRCNRPEETFRILYHISAEKSSYIDEFTGEIEACERREAEEEIIGYYDYPPDSTC